MGGKEIFFVQILSGRKITPPWAGPGPKTSQRKLAAYPCLQEKFLGFPAELSPSSGFGGNQRVSGGIEM
jgi:hypothetical protein